MTDSWLATLRERLPRHADELSDLDVGIGAEDGAWEAANRCAELLRSAAAGARTRIGSPDGESPMAAWVSERLRAYA